MDVMPGETDYNSTRWRAAAAENTYIVRAIVTFGTDVSAQKKLDSLLETDPSTRSPR